MNSAHNRNVASISERRKYFRGHRIKKVIILFTLQDILIYHP